MVVATLAVKYDSVKRETQCLNKMFWSIALVDFAIIFGDLFNMAPSEVPYLCLCVYVFAFFLR